MPHLKACGRCCHLGSIVVAHLLLSTAAFSAEAEDAEDWVRGVGENLEIRIRGEIYSSRNLPAKQPRLTATLQNESSQSVPVAMNGSRFELWIPVNRTRWGALRLDATAADKRERATSRIALRRIREAAIDGISMTLQHPVRTVEINVVDQGMPAVDAHVKAKLTSGAEIPGKTSGDGIFDLELLPGEAIVSLTSWTDDHKIGGFQFHQLPVRDPNAASQTIELSSCRDQKIRTVDRDGKPVAGIRLILQVATPPPNYNYLGVIEQSEMPTDKSGEAVFQWFPDWDAVHCYADLYADRWAQDGQHAWVDGAIVITVKPKTRRYAIVGRVNRPDGSKAGFHVSLRSDQGDSVLDEGSHTSDRFETFTDSQGRFRAQILADATYCVFINDSRYITEMIDLVPYRSSSSTRQIPVLNVSKGEPVQVKLTRGRSRNPIADQSVRFSQKHDYEFAEDGRTRRGTKERAFWATTDMDGSAVVNAAPGKKLLVSVSSPDWRAEEEIVVVAGQRNLVEIHREIDEPRRVSGQLFGVDDLKINFKNAEVIAGAIDGQSRGMEGTKASSDGLFSFGSKAKSVGVLATTSDGKASGVATTDDLTQFLRVKLLPTGELRGRLVDGAGEPIANCIVHVIVRIRHGVATNGPSSSLPFPTSFEAKRFESKTDGQGNYTFSNLPCNFVLSLTARPTDSFDDHGLGTALLVPGEKRPIEVHHIADRVAASSVTDRPIAERFDRMTRDCRLSGFHLMVIVGGVSAPVTSFIDEQLISPFENKLVSSFMQLQVPSINDLSAEGRRFAKARNWPNVGDEEVFACAYGPSGKEIGRANFSADDPNAADRTAEFVGRHAPKQVDAKRKWVAAFAESERSGRRVWMRISRNYCGPCVVLARWLDDHRTILEKDYVFLKIDNARDLHGDEVAKRLLGDRSFGIPFHGIFCQDGKLMIDSEGASGNIGAASGFEGRNHLGKMLQTTKKKLTDDEVERLVESVGY